MFGKILMTGLSPMVYTSWDSLDSDIFNLLTCVHVIWNRFCCYLVYHKRSTATNHSELTSSRQAVDWAVPQTEGEQEWGNHCRVEHLKRFDVPAECYARRSPVRQEKEGVEELREERREGKRQWKWMFHWWILLHCLTWTLLKLWKSFISQEKWNRRNLNLHGMFYCV